MKKLAAVLLFALCTVLVYSQSQDGWTGFGPGWSNQWETSGDSEVKTYMSSFAVDISSFNFNNLGNIGFFSCFSLIFPLTSTLEYNDIKVTVDMSNYDFIMGLNDMLGLGFRQKINENTLFMGIGPDIGLLFATSEYARQFSFLLGIGGELGLKCGITDLISISFGSAITYDFLCYTIGSNAVVGEISGLAKDYSLFTIKPFIRISFNRYKDEAGKTHWGRYKKN